MVVLVTVIFVAPVFLIVTPASASAAWYVTDLGILGLDVTLPTGINDHDQVSATAYSYVDAFNQQAFVYDSVLGNWIHLPSLGERANAEGMNDWGEIVGSSKQSSSDPTYGVYWPSSDSSVPIRLLPLAGHTVSAAYALNDAHQAVGESWASGVGTVVVQWDLDQLASDISAQEIGTLPGMGAIEPLDINNFGAVVGYGFAEDATHLQAFYCEGLGDPIQTLIPLSGGIDGPSSQAIAISDTGLIVGASADTNDYDHAVVWTSPSAAPIDLGVGYSSYANDVNDDGTTIVGNTYVGLPSTGFVYHNYPYGPVEILDRPPGSTDVWNNPVAINELGHVVSSVRMSSDPWYDNHAFLWTPNAPPQAKFTFEGVGELTVSLDASASFDTDGTINSYDWDFGDGTTGSGMTVSYTYAVSGKYTITLVVTDDLGLSGSTACEIGVGLHVGDMTDLTSGFDCRGGEANFINNNGQVAGIFGPLDRPHTGTFYWDSTTGFVDVGYLPGSAPITVVTDLNGEGQIVGTQHDYRRSNYVAFFWDKTMTQPMALGNLPGGTTSRANAVNDLGYVVGDGQVGSAWHAFSWDPNTKTMSDLNGYMPAGVTTSRATGINDRGHVVGTYLGADNNVYVFMWDGTVMTDITYELTPYMDQINVLINENDDVVVVVTGTGYHSHHWSSGTALTSIGNVIAQSINDVGEVVGIAHGSPNFQRAFRWSLSTGLSYLGTATYGDSIAYDINNMGYAVGFETVDNDGWKQRAASLWKPDGTMVILGDLEGGMGVSCAYAVNDGDKVVGGSEAFVDGSYVTHPFVWTTDPPSPPIAMFTVDWVSATTNVTVMLDASSSTDADGRIVGYAWDFGDGKTGLGMNVYHTFATSGIFTVTLVVTDDEGLTGSTSEAVDGTVAQAPVEEIADLRDTINATDTSDAIKQELSALAVKAEQLIESRRSHAYDQATSTLLTLVTRVEQYTIVGEIDPGDGWNLTCEADLIMALLTNQVMIKGVPNYEWYHGCGPTAVGMVVGYWDSMKFNDLIAGDVSVENDIAASMIASSGHIKDYALFPDGWEVQEDSPGSLIKDASDPSLQITPHGDDCIADFMHTSFYHDGCAYGQSLTAKVIDGFVEYVGHVSPTGKYAGTAKEITGKSLSWSYITRQVKAQHPMAFVVDINGDHKGDHLVTVIGYCSIGKAKLYAFYSTFDDTIWWANFELMQNTVYFGIYNAFEFKIA